jgi:hypothetical protein
MWTHKEEEGEDDERVEEVVHEGQAAAARGNG